MVLVDRVCLLLNIHGLICNFLSAAIVPSLSFPFLSSGLLVRFLELPSWSLCLLPFLRTKCVFEHPSYPCFSEHPMSGSFIQSFSFAFLNGRLILLLLLHGHTDVRGQGFSIPCGSKIILTGSRLESRSAVA